MTIVYKERITFERTRKKIRSETGMDQDQFALKMGVMNSDIAKGLDDEFDYMQWAGKEYIFERMQDEYPKAFVKNGIVFDREPLYWAGYVYRQWYFYTGETSKQIYKQANAETMNIMYLGYHTMDVKMAIDRLKEAKG